MNRCLCGVSIWAAADRDPCGFTPRSTDGSESSSSWSRIAIFTMAPPVYTPTCRVQSFLPILTDAYFPFHLFFLQSFILGELAPLCTHGGQRSEVREQFIEVGSFLLYGSRNWNSGHQAWWQVSHGAPEWTPCHCSFFFVLLIAVQSRQGAIST